MSSQPFNAAALRGAVDLSALSRPATPSTGGAPGGEEAGPGAGLRVEGTDSNFASIVNSSVTVPAVVVLWSSGLPESAQFVDTVESVVRSLDGRIQLVSVDVDANPGLLRAFQVQSVPVAIGLLQGQPVPLFIGVQPEEHVRAYLEELLKLAVQHGVTGRVDTSGAEDASTGEEGREEEAPLPPLHQEAYDAIERDDLDAAAAAYERALQENPTDADAKLGLAQVNLMKRTAGADLQAARAAAATDPTDVAAQTLVADLDVLGGHVEDAFSRLIDTVRATTGEDRNAAREHLVELFDVVGAGDERVRKARGALMSALF
jgi:putative thioredoxin